MALALGVVVGAAVTAGLALSVIGWLRQDTPSERGAVPIFVEETGTAGIDQVYAGEFQHFVGGGVAVFDCNDDQLDDLYVAGGTDPAGLWINQSEIGGEISFGRASASQVDLAGVTGAYPIDVDSDGIVDLAVLRVGENRMLRGLGDCQFEDANDTWGVDGGDDWTVAFSAYWQAGDDLPTLAFGNYLRLKSSGDRDECEDHYLFRPDGLAYGDPEVLSPGWCTLSILISDWARTGSPALRMTNDRHYYTGGGEQLWQLGADFAATYGPDDGWRELQIWGMGIATQDLTGDGLPEVFLTSQGDSKLQTLSPGENGPAYDDMALAAGVTAHRPFLGDINRPSTAWHAEFDDINNDGFTDLFITKGNVDAQVDFAMEDPNNLLLGGPGGVFEESAGQSGVVDLSRSRGASVTDLNLDGLLDLIVVERRESVKVWRNVGSQSDDAHWLSLELAQPAPNRQAIGARVEVKVGSAIVEREITIGGGHAGGHLGRIHFGLGAADRVDIRVVWPDGDTTGWESVSADQHLVWDRGSSIPQSSSR